MPTLLLVGAAMTTPEGARAEALGITVEWFMARVVPEPNSGCWLWVGGVSDRGYAVARLLGRNRPMHRIACLIFRGEDPPQLDGDHLCRVRSCVNPQHVEFVPHRVNVLRGICPTAENARKSTCREGHPYSGDNLIVRIDRRDGSTFRRCRECEKSTHVERHRRETERRRARRAAARA